MPADSGPGSELSDSQQHHLVEYCRTLTGNEDDAASLAQSVRASAQSLLTDPMRFRAWLFALARREALLANPGGATSADGDREILDLVHRHGIQAADLSVVLGIPAEEASARLAAAERQLSRLADAKTVPGSPAGPDGVARPALVGQPEAVRPRSAHMLVAVAAAVAVAVIAGAVYFLGGFANSAGSRGHAAPGAHRSPAAAPSAPSVARSEKPTAIPAATVITPVSASGFDALSSPTQDPGNENSAQAMDVLTGKLPVWSTQQYTGQTTGPNPTFGNLKAGTGFILNLGKPYKVSSVTVTFGSQPGADVQVKVSDSATRSPANLAAMTTVASASDVSGVHTFTVQNSVAGQYLVVWFTKLPPVAGSTGKFAAQILHVVVKGSLA